MSECKYIYIYLIMCVYNNWSSSLNESNHSSAFSETPSAQHHVVFSANTSSVATHSALAGSFAIAFGVGHEQFVGHSVLIKDYLFYKNIYFNFLYLYLFTYTLIYDYFIFILYKIK